MNSSQTAYVGVAVGKTTPLGGRDYSADLSITNFSSEDASIFVKSSATQDEGMPNTEDHTITVPGMSSKTVSLSINQADSELQNSVLVESSVAPALVFTKLTSHAPGATPVLEYQPKDARQKQNSGLHPWSLASGKQSRLLLFNYTAQEQYFNVKVYADGTDWQRSWLLKPMETHAVDIKQLVANQLPDQKGNKLPKTAVSGEIQWSTPGRYKGVGRMLVSDINQGLARNFSCGQCVVLCGGVVAPANLFLTINDFGLLDAAPDFCISDACQCKDGWETSYSGDGYVYSWDTDNSAVTTISGSTTSESANFQGNGAGNANGSVSITDPNCTTFASAPVDVLAINQNKQLWYFGGQSTPSGFQQGSTTVTLTLNGASQGTFAWSLTNGSVASALFENGQTSMTKTNVNSIGLTSQNRSSDSNDKVSITLVYTDPSNNRQTLSWPVLIEAPNSLVSAGNQQLRGIGSCLAGQFGPSGSNGWELDVPYGVRSRLGGVPVANEYVNEQFDTRVDVTTPNNWGSPTPGGIATGGSDMATFFDIVCASGQGTPQPLTPYSGTSTQVFHIHQTWRSGSTTPGSGQQVQVDILHYWNNQGSVEITTH